MRSRILKLVGVAVAVAVALAPGVAAAKCISATVGSCFCGAVEIVEGTTRTLRDETVVLELTRCIFPDVCSVSGELEVRRQSWDKTGGRSAVLLGEEVPGEGDRWTRRLRISADDEVLCRDRWGKFPVPVGDVPQVAGPECRLELERRGFEEPRCRDVGPFFCGAAPAAAATWAILPALLALAARRRRRR